MGRPLNKKYFGNRNVGSTSTENDNKIGGEGIASINWSNYGSWLSTAGGSNAPLAGLQLPAPSIPGGVQATWTNYFGAAAVTTGAGKTGLIAGETYEYAPIPGLIITVGSLAGANALFTVTAPGSTTTLLTDLQTVSITLRTGQGHTGVGTFTVDISLKIVNTVIGEQGSGYTGAETITVTLANSATGTVPAGTIVLTTDDLDANGNQYASQSGDANRDAYEENAILIYAKTTSGGTALLGDIIKQTNSHSYKVKTSDGTAVCKLVDTTSLNAGEAYIVATATGGTYYVTKLTAHKATLVAKTGDEALDGQAVRWTFGSPSATIVQIANA